MGKFLDWLNGLFRTSGEDIPAKARDPTAVRLELERLTIQNAVGLLASAVSQCDFRTFYQGREIYKREWYLWNIAPNCNENSTQFLQKLVRSLIYNNEVVIFEHGGGLWIADRFQRIPGGTQPDFYTGVGVEDDTASFDLPASQVIRLQYNNAPVTALLTQVCHEYEDLIAEATKSYRKSFADKGVVSYNAMASGSPKMQEVQDDLFNNRFRKFYEAESAVLPLPNGFTYTPQSRSVRNASEMNDVKLLGDEITNRVGQALRIPPALLRGEVANLQDVRENFVTFAVVPLLDQIAEGVNSRRYADYVLSGSYLMADPTPLFAASIVQAAEPVDKLIACGVWSVDEARVRLHEPALGTPEANTHWITKNYDAQTRVLKGSEEA